MTSWKRDQEGRKKLFILLPLMAFFSCFKKKMTCIFILHWAYKLCSWPSFRINQELQEMIFRLRCYELLAFPQLQNLYNPDVISYNYVYAYSKHKFYTITVLSCENYHLFHFSIADTNLLNSSWDFVYHWWQKKIANLRKLSDFGV